MSDAADADGDTEGRVADLEARFAFLDDQVQQLDALVTAQRDVLDELRLELQRIKETLQSMQLDMPDGSPEPPPPHY